MNEERLYTQIRENYDLAFVARIKEAVTKGEHKYITDLIREIRDRIKRQIPNRKDIHESLDSHIDVDLIQQMLENNAFNTDDFYNIINIFLQYVEELQAPVDNSMLEIVKAKLNNLEEKTWADAVAPFFLDVNQLIDRIEKRRHDAMQNPFVMAMIRQAMAIQK